MISTPEVSKRSTCAQIKSLYALPSTLSHLSLSVFIYLTLATQFPAGEDTVASYRVF